jgi:hypothetical protein
MPPPWPINKSGMANHHMKSLLQHHHQQNQKHVLVLEELAMQLMDMLSRTSTDQEHSSVIW